VHDDHRGIIGDLGETTPDRLRTRCAAGDHDGRPLFEARAGRPDDHHPIRSGDGDGDGVVHDTEVTERLELLGRTETTA
jgi:hypothetical protein